MLTCFASYLGPAEVAAWAILGSIWGVFYSVTDGIGDAAEIRVSHHLGENQPTMAQLSSYKSLFLGMVVASIVSIVYFSLQNDIPAWFTDDETLQSMLRELVPFVGVANLTMTFGMQVSVENEKTIDFNWILVVLEISHVRLAFFTFVISVGHCLVPRANTK